MCFDPSVINVVMTKTDVNDQTYDAYDRDITIVNIFMGEATAQGLFKFK